MHHLAPFVETQCTIVGSANLVALRVSELQFDRTRMSALPVHPGWNHFALVSFQVAVIRIYRRSRAAVDIMLVAGIDRTVTISQNFSGD